MKYIDVLSLNYPKPLSDDDVHFPLEPAGASAWLDDKAARYKRLQMRIYARNHDPRQCSKPCYYNSSILGTSHV